MLRLWALVLVAVTAGAGCLHWNWPPWRAEPAWQVARSKRFVVYTRPGVALPPTLTALEQSYAMLQASLFPNRVLEPVEILLLDWPELRPVLGNQRTGASIAELPGKAGKGGEGRRGLVVMYGLDATTAGSLHRLAHLFVHAASPRAPLWLHEGLASHLEAATVLAGQGQAEATVCLGQLPQKQDEMPLSELFVWSWAAFDDTASKEAKRASAYRATARSVVDFLLTAEGGKLRDKLGDLFDALADGGATEAALAKVYGGLTPAALQEKLVEHRRTREAAAGVRCPIPYSLPAENFADSAKAKITNAPEGVVEGLLTQLRMLPRRDGQVDWYPPSMIGVEGGSLTPPPAGKP
jgi:hypothetical protein